MKNSVMFAVATGTAWGALVLLSGQELPSVAPRDAASEYVTHASTGRTELAAELLPRDEAARFFTPLEDQYYVVEIAVFPKKGRIIDLERGDFRLRAASKTLKPQNPHAIATFLTKTAPPEPGMHTTTRRSESVGVRMETGRPTEVFQEKRGGVGISSGRYWTSEDRETMYRELSALELRGGSTIQPIAGYLYFAIKAEGSVENMELIYQGGSEKVVLSLR